MWINKFCLISCVAIVCGCGFSFTTYQSCSEIRLNEISGIQNDVCFRNFNNYFLAHNKFNSKSPYQLSVEFVEFYNTYLSTSSTSRIRDSKLTLICKYTLKKYNKVVYDDLVIADTIMTFDDENHIINKDKLENAKNRLAITNTKKAVDIIYSKQTR